jgi:hypothetical protein
MKTSEEYQLAMLASSHESALGTSHRLVGSAFDMGLRACGWSANGLRPRSKLTKR